MASKANDLFWLGFEQKMEAFARGLSGRCGVHLQCEPADFAQMAVRATVAFLAKRYAIDPSHHVLPQKIRDVAFAYAYKCTRNALLSEITRIRKEEMNQTSCPQFRNSEGIFDLTVRRSVSPEELAIARDFAHRVGKAASKVRRERIQAALLEILEGGNGNLSADLTDLADITANELAYERKRLRSLFFD